MFCKIVFIEDGQQVEFDSHEIIYIFQELIKQKKKSTHLLDPFNLEEKIKKEKSLYKQMNDFCNPPDDGENKTKIIKKNKKNKKPIGAVSEREDAVQLKSIVDLYLKANREREAALNELILSNIKILIPLYSCSDNVRLTLGYLKRNEHTWV